MEHYVGLGVSIKETSICVVDSAGRVLREVKVASEPEAIVALWLTRLSGSHGLGSRQGRCCNGFTVNCGGRLAYHLCRDPAHEGCVVGTGQQK